METKYHINPETKRPNVCRVKLDNCPVSTDSSDHYPDKETAQEALKSSENTADTLSYKVEDVVDTDRLEEEFERATSGFNETKESAKEIVEEVSTGISEGIADKKTEVKQQSDDIARQTEEKVLAKGERVRGRISAVFSFISKYSGKIADTISPSK